MVAFLIHLRLDIRSRFTRRARLEADNLILRQQLVVLRRKSAARVRLWNFDSGRWLLANLHPSHSGNGDPRSSDRTALTLPEWLARTPYRIDVGFSAPAQAQAPIASIPVLGGLHHQYVRFSF